MTFYLNSSGKIAAAGLAAGVAKAAITGDSTELKSGCLGALVAWILWVGFIFTMFYYLIFK